MNNNLKLCSNCGANNSTGSAFCISCGSKFEQLVNINQEPIADNSLNNEIPQQTNIDQTLASNEINNQNLSNNQVQQQNIVQNNLSNSTNQAESNKTASNNSINYLKYMFNVLLKPCTEFKKQEINRI